VWEGRITGIARRRVLQGGLAIGGLGLLLACDMRGEQAAKVRRIGFLGVGSREGRAFLIEGLRRGLREHGYAEGKNLVIEYRFSEDRDDRLPELAQELVKLQVELIVASGTPASFAAKKATSTIPLVMGGVAANPVETGLVESLARPGGNVTGMSMMTSQLGGKRLELLKDIVPGLSRVAVLWNAANPAYGPVLRELEAVAPSLRVQIDRVEARSPADLDGALAAAKRRSGALIVPADPLTTNRQQLIAELALKHRVAAMMEYKEFVRAGGLVSLGVDLADLYRRSAAHVDKILKGAKPGELPMEQPTKLDVSINLRTARALGLAIPDSVTLKATEVVP
jgi:putative ABC transport system substrate-binding protein